MYRKIDFLFFIILVFILKRRLLLRQPLSGFALRRSTILSDSKPLT